VIPVLVRAASHPLTPLCLLPSLSQKPVTGTDSMKDFVLVNGGIEPVLKMTVGAGALGCLARFVAWSSSTASAQATHHCPPPAAC